MVPLDVHIKTVVWRLRSMANRQTERKWKRPRVRGRALASGEEGRDSDWERGQSKKPIKQISNSPAPSLIHSNPLLIHSSRVLGPGCEHLNTYHIWAHERWTQEDRWEDERAAAPPLNVSILWQCEFCYFASWRLIGLCACACGRGGDGDVFEKYTHVRL